MARTPDRDELVDEVGGIRIGHEGVPLWLMFVIVGVISWGLYYLLTYTVTETGTFETPAGIILRF